MVIGPDFVFLCVPRCASTMMRDVFLPKYGGQHVEPHHGRMVSGEHSHKFTFAIVRNPYDRQLSVFRHLKKSGSILVRDETPDSFVRWCMRYDNWDRKLIEATVGPEVPDRLTVNQVKFLSMARVDRVIKYESIGEEIGKLPFCVGAELPEEKVNDADVELPSYSRMDFISAVNEHSMEDFEAFAYEML